MPPAKHILVADDESHLRSALFEVLTRQGHAVEPAENGLEAWRKFKAQNFDLVITDIRMPQMDGLSLLREIKKYRAATPVILITAYGTVETAVEAMREGAQDFILKPFSTEIIEGALERALMKENPPPHALNDQAAAPIGHDRPIITNSSKMKKLLEMAKRVAVSSATVLLQGESGTGKELLARFIHFNSPRAKGPFVAVNCASLPESLLESELFGHEKGAFTGAVARKQGKFELADGGSILLDEVSEMDMALQAKLLRVLQEGEIDRVGGKAPHKIDVRVIATTNRNLKQWVAEGRFRADLYYRLNVIPLYLPSLKERPGDVAALAEFFREKYARLNNKQVAAIAPEAVKALEALDWPGNVRELENIVARGVLLASGRIMGAADFFLDETDFMAALEAAPLVEAEPEAFELQPTPVEEGEAKLTAPQKRGPAWDGFQPALPEPPSPEPPSPEPALPVPAMAPLMTIGEMEKHLIGRALDETSGNRTHAAKILGISVRTLRNKLAEYREGRAV